MPHAQGLTVIVMAPNAQEMIVQVPHLHYTVTIQAPLTEVAPPLPPAPVPAPPLKTHGARGSFFDYAVVPPAPVSEPKMVQRDYLYCGIDRLGHIGDGSTIRVPIFTLGGVPIPPELRRKNEIWGYGGGELNDKDSWES